MEILNPPKIGDVDQDAFVFIREFAANALVPGREVHITVDEVRYHLNGPPDLKFFYLNYLQDGILHYFRELE